MNPLFLFYDCFCRILSRKKTLIVFIFLLLCSTMCGILFVKTPAIYAYHLNICDKFIDRICYSSRSVFLIFLERLAGNSLILLLLMIAGIHVAGLAVTPAAIAYRGYVFGGSLVIFFSVYRVSGALIVFALYLPIHILIDAIFLCAVSLSFSRASRFKFCTNDFKELICDFFLLFSLVVAVCFVEALLLLVLFHPIGNLL